MCYYSGLARCDASRDDQSIHWEQDGGQRHESREAVVEAAPRCLIPTGFAVSLLGNPVVFDELLQVNYDWECI